MDGLAGRLKPSSHHLDSPVQPPYTELLSDSSPYPNTSTKTSSQHGFTISSNPKHVMGANTAQAPGTPPDVPVTAAATGDSRHRHGDEGYENEGGENHHEDLLPKIKGLFRLLDLYSEQSSGGLVDKILIAQDSLKSLIETLLPGAYTSITQINFTALDHVHIRAIGLYGSKSEIVRLLQRAGAVGKETADLLLLSDQASQPNLRSGIYLFLPPVGRLDLDRGHVPTVYIIYWPEDTTWDDAAGGGVKRNRVTFMRYLTRLTDQIRILASTEHAASIVWKETESESNYEDDRSSDSGDSRVYPYNTTASHEEEDVHVHPGFVLKHQAIGSPTSDHDSSTGAEAPEASRPTLVAGEMRQGFRIAVNIPEGTEHRNINGTFSRVHLASMLGDRHVYIDRSIDEKSLLILMTDGQLSSRVPDLYRDHVKTVDKINEDIDAQYHKQIKIASHKIKSDRSLLEKGLKRKIALILHEYYPILNLITKRTAVADEVSSHLANLFNMLPEVYQMCNMVFGGLDINKIPAQNYKNLKRRFLFVQAVIEKRGDTFDDDQRAIFVQRILISNDPIDTGEVGEDSKGKIEQDIQQLVKSRLSEPDPEFLRSIQETIAGESSLTATARELIILAREWAEKEISELSSSMLHKVESAQLINLEKQVRLGLQPQGTEKRMLALQSFRDSLNGLFVPKGSTPDLTLSKVRECPGSRGREFNVLGHHTIRVEPAVRYRIWPIELTESDNLAFRHNPLHVPDPRLRRQSIDFTLPKDHLVRHVQLLRNNHFLVVTDSLEGTRIWLQSESKPFSLKPTKQLPLFCQYVVAVDEVKRLMLFVCMNNGRCTLNVFAMDEELTHLSSCGSPYDVTTWYTDGAAQIKAAVFFPGTEELCLIEQSGRARVYSFLDLGFRPVAIQLPLMIESAHAAPDTSALLVVEGTMEGIKQIRVFHRAAFDNENATQGVVRDLPDQFNHLGTQFIVTSLGQRNVTLLALLPRTPELHSVAVEISRQEEGFYLQLKEDQEELSKMVAKTHNSLLNCFGEVWDRFPVISAIKRETILADGRLAAAVTFVTDESTPEFTPYFKDMIQSFKKRSRKPTKGQLDSIQLGSLPFRDIDWDRGSGSVFWAGEWLVELLCLIPIHIAVARENHFIPLKDGIFDLRFQQQLLGAEVFKIIDNLSIGWYESIFNSYHAKKEVKVISSMGEQSVGKSYSLNHIVDSSFAGSALRTTEGVWLSVCPLEKTLVVALDFEGIYSIERTPQEDMLLVLLNAALSNLIIFRNNFALGREVAKMFTSFQASACMFDPEANPRLFQGCLAVVIKDVVDGDKQEIVQEFSKKFDQICRKDKTNNFIKRLHANQLRIIPWNVIESPKFYTLFSQLRKQLFKQETTHASAGEFLMTLKTLMAKLKAQDWGAMDQTLVKHRCALLSAYLPRALETGYAEVDHLIEELKNLDNQEVIPSSDSKAMFYLGNSPLERQDNFRGLLTSLHIESAHNDVTELQQHIRTMVQARVTHVGRWINANISRFQTDSADILAIKREFKDLSEALNANTSLCLIKCSSCQLSCLLVESHESQDHDCNTNHMCLERCEFLDDHNGLSEDDDSCDLPAGHGGPHICGGTEHVCGRICFLSDRRGCQQRCTKTIGHEGEEHACSARVHQCGEPCSLRHVQYTCNDSCTRPFGEGHDRHSCDNLSCPIRCELCPSLCTLGGHLHSMDAAATPMHLCGQRHSCKHDCDIPGYCEVITIPHAVKIPFERQHELFRSTKYTQVAKRHACVITIPSGERDHPGPHVHSTATNSFHYCKAECLSCGYICQLSFGHSQLEHRTVHGSMEKTSWVIGGAADEFVEIRGLKYSAQDGGGSQLCSSVCSDLGRHVHIDYCRNAPDNCREPESEHITHPIHPNPSEPKDWISHKAFWDRSGFEDPYSSDDRAEFAKCDAQCAGPEHEATDDSPARPSYCNLPIFHLPLPPHAAGSTTSHVSADGHSFPCPHPNSFQQAFHIIFILDRSGSMAHTDKQPIKNTPWTAKIVQHNPNRFGAVLSAVYGFWNSRNSDFRRDSYSVILFNSSPQTLINHDVTSTPDELLDRIVSIQPTGGTDFNAALESAKSLMETHWSTDRSPVFIFLSDGEGGLSDYIVRDICQRAAIRQKPLSLHAVSFASATIDLFQMVRASLDRTRSGSLRRMVAIAEGVVQGAPRNPPSPVAECTYTDAIDTIRLAETFLDISRSLKKSRAALIPTNRRQPTNYRLITLFSPRSLPYAQGQGKGFRGDEIETIRV